MIVRDFLGELKRVTESSWKYGAINPHVYGFQFQSGTKWNPGLSETHISDYEDILRVRFPHDFKALLRAMNGTDLPTLNIYGSSGEPPQYSVGVYSYARDMEIIQRRVESVRQDRSEIAVVLAEQGFALSPEARLMPIFSHRYVVCETNLDSSVVLSIHGADAIVYGNNLQEYLTKEFSKT
jgi:hypothetical protein